MVFLHNRFDAITGQLPIAHALPAFGDVFLEDLLEALRRLHSGSRDGGVSTGAGASAAGVSSTGS